LELLNQRPPADRRHTIEEDLHRRRFVVTFGATAAAPAMAEQFANPFSQR